MRCFAAVARRVPISAGRGHDGRRRLGLVRGAGRGSGRRSSAPPSPVSRPMTKPSPRRSSPRRTRSASRVWRSSRTRSIFPFPTSRPTRSRCGSTSRDRRPLPISSPTLRADNARANSRTTSSVRTSSRSSRRCTTRSPSASGCSGATSRPRARSRSERSSRRPTECARTPRNSCEPRNRGSRTSGAFTDRARRSPGPRLVLGPDELLSVVSYGEAVSTATTAA